MRTKNPLIRLWELGNQHRGKLKVAIVLALLGVIFGFLPYFCAAKMIVGLVGGESSFSFYVNWSLLAMCGYALKTVLYNLALSQSHKGTFRILRDIRQMVMEKLPKLPLGSVMDISSGKLKQIIVDQVESMETTLAHLLPEMTSNLLAPILVVLYMLVLDWRMALLSLVSIPVGMVFMMIVMKNYGKDYEGSVKVTQDMNETIVEYCNNTDHSPAYCDGCWNYRGYEKRQEKGQILL